MSTSITVGKAVVNSYNPYVTLTVTESSTSATANTSTLTYKLVIYRPSSISSTASKSYTFKINGTSYSGTTTIGGSGTKTITSGTQTVSHSSDGTKTISLSLSFTFAITWSGTYMGKYSTSGTMDLTDIDRTAPTITISSYSVTNSTITIAATSNVSCNTWQYSTNGGSSYTTFKSGSATSVSTTISGLSANTTYSTRIRAYKVSNNVKGYTTESITTLGASSITSASALTLSSSGTACSVKFTPYSTSYYYTLTFTIGSKSVTTSRFCPGTTSAYTYTGYSFTLATWAPYITSATSATCTAVLTTYASSSTSTAMGTSSKTFTVSVPSSVVPVINSVTFSEGAEDFPSIFEGYYVQTFSALAIDVDAEALYSATVSSITAKVSGTTYDVTSGGTTDTITTSGTLSIVVTVTDSRGRTASGTYTVDVVSYHTPTLTLTYSTTSDSITATAAGEISSVEGLNSGTASFYVVAASDSSLYYEGEFDLAGGTYEQAFSLSDESAQTLTWTITATVADAAGNTVTATKNTGVTALSFLSGGTGAAFFKEAETSGAVEVNGYFYTVRTGKDNLLLGRAASANNNYGTAVGTSASVGNYGAAIGYGANASGYRCAAIGASSAASSSYAIALGCNSAASGYYDIALGYNSAASGGYAIALGCNSAASVYLAIALGYNSAASGNYAMALGYNSAASAVLAMALGYNSAASGNYDTALGYNSNAYRESATSLGSSSTAGYRSTATGASANASGSQSVAFGRTAYATGVNSTALGHASNASGSGATALGQYAVCANTNGVQLGNASYTSTLTCKVSLTTTSDIRDKADITEIEDGATEFLKKIKAIRYVFNGREMYIDEGNLTDEDREKKAKYGLCAYDKEAWAAGTKKGSRIRVGVSAQEVLQALEDVYGDQSYGNLVNDNLYDFEDVPDDVESQLAVNYDGFIPFLIKAFQEINARVTALEEADA